MAGWHQTIIIGHVGKEPELRYTQNGVAVCSFSVAVGEKWKTDGDTREKTTWYTVSCWKKLAETCNQYVNKGMQIMVTGNVEARGYTNNAGEVAASLELTARDVQFLGSKRDDNQGGGAGYEDDIPF